MENCEKDEGFVENTKNKKYGYEDCPFQEGQEVDLVKRKARVRWMKSHTFTDKKGIKRTSIKKTGASSFLKKGKQKIIFVAPRYTYSHPFYTRTDQEGEINDELGTKKQGVISKIPHAYVNIDGKLGSIEMRDLISIQLKIEKKEDWNDPTL